MEKWILPTIEERLIRLVKGFIEVDTKNNLFDEYNRDSERWDCWQSLKLCCLLHDARILIKEMEDVEDEIL